MIKSIKYRIQNFLFTNLAIPKIRDEKIAKRYIKKFLPKDPVIIDCGAHDGTDSRELVSLIGGQVFAFEPVPAVFEKLREKSKAYSLIRCFQLALADKKGTIDFYVSSGSSDGSSSILPPKDHLADHPSVTFNEVIKVPCNTLDSWAEENGIKKIDLLWLDMQGFEMPMLLASPKMLSSVTAIHTEVSVRETYSGVATYDKLKKWLEQQGFIAALEAIPEGWDMGNVLFIRKN